MRLLVITYNLSISTFGYRVLLVHCMSRYTSPYGHNVVKCCSSHTIAMQNAGVLFNLTDC